MMRVLLVDDEPLSLTGLKHILSGESSVQIVGTATNGDAAVRAINALQPDLVFLDVKMPGLTGFEVASAVHCKHSPEIIFVSAFEQYAIEAFAIEAVDYLLKPVQPERVRQSLLRVRRRRSAAKGNNEIDHIGRSALLHFPDRHGGFDIPQAEIVWIEAAKDYALIHTDNRSFMLRTTMHELAEQLLPSLTRVHRSAYVSLNRVQRILLSGRGIFSVVLSDNIEVQVGPSYAQSVRKALRRLRHYEWR